MGKVGSLTGHFVTLNLTLAFFLPRVAVAVMVTLPAFLKVTTPFLTVAIFLLLLVHLMPLLVPAGRVAVRVVLVPFFAATVPDRFSLTQVGMVGSLTVRVKVRVFLPILMVILALPWALGVMTPFLSTVATFFLEDLKLFAVAPFRSILYWVPTSTVALADFFATLITGVVAEVDAGVGVGVGATVSVGAKTRQIRDRNVVFRAGQRVCKPGAVDIKRHAVCPACRRDLLQLRLHIQRPQFRGLGQIDRPGHHHMVAAHIRKIRFRSLSDLLRRDLSPDCRQRKDLMSSFFHRACFMPVDMPRRRAENPLIRCQQRAENRRVRLRAAAHEEDLRVRTSARFTDLFPCFFTQFILAVSGDLSAVGPDERLLHGGMCAVHIIRCKR